MDEQRQALENLLKRYVELAKSGDAGFWNPEEEPVVIAARAALTPSAPVDERGWVVEKRGTLPVEYVCASSAGFEFTTDNLGAIRFCRREDANQVAEILDGEDVAIVEHMWCGPTPSAPVAEAAPIPFSRMIGFQDVGQALKKHKPNVLHRFSIENLTRIAEELSAPTQIKYSCGCSASAGTPDYCPEHGPAPPATKPAPAEPGRLVNLERSQETWIKQGQKD